MNTCKTCKWWVEHQETKNPNGTVSDYMHHQCTHHKIGGGDSDTDGLDDQSDFDHGIGTGPNFGCIHHEQKP
jgi:hypothetical protein